MREGGLEPMYVIMWEERKDEALTVSDRDLNPHGALQQKDNPLDIETVKNLLVGAAKELTLGSRVLRFILVDTGPVNSRDVELASALQALLVGYSVPIDNTIKKQAKLLGALVHPLLSSNFHPGNAT